MARFNEIYAGRFNRALQKVTAIKGEPPSPQLASEIQPVLPLPLGVEYLIYESWDRWATFFGVAAVAAQFGQFQIRNPTNSNIVAVIEKLTIFGQTGSNVNVLLAAGTADNPTILVPRPLDGRNPRPNASLITSTQTTAGGASSNIYNFPNVAGIQDMIVDDHQEIVLTQGNVIILQNSVVNLTLTGTIFWRERFLEDSERSI